MKEKGGEVCINRFSVNPSSLTHCDAVGGAGPAPRQTPVPTCVPLKGGKDPRQRVGGSVKAKRPIPIHPQKLPAGLPYEFHSTPPYGGDPLPSLDLADQHDFNPRPHTGATIGRWSSAPSCRFHSTPPYGGDTFQLDFQVGYLDFNPRPHTGATFHGFVFRYLDKISIHAPIRGRRRRGNADPDSGKFQSTPPYGGD